jgi:hypothetical protein
LFYDWSYDSTYEGNVSCDEILPWYEKQGIDFKTKLQWDGDPNFEFVITGRSDSDYEKDELRRSVSGYSTFLCGAPI